MLQRQSLLVSGKRVQSQLSNNDLVMAEDKFSIGQVLSHKLLGIMAEKGKLSFSDHISKLKRHSKVSSLVAMSHLFFFFLPFSLYFRPLILMSS